MTKVGAGGAKPRAARKPYVPRIGDWFRLGYLGDHVLMSIEGNHYVMLCPRGWNLRVRRLRKDRMLRDYGELTLIGRRVGGKLLRRTQMSTRPVQAIGQQSGRGRAKRPTGGDG
jgi:hypothetical protein